MEEVNKTVEVATDTNIIRHATPRRYLTALEEMQGHRVIILPMVDSELHVQLVIHARKYIHRLCKKNGGISNEVRRSAIRAAGEAVTDWWKGEHGRNDSIYYFVDSLGDDRYRKFFLDLPDEAFKNENGRDQIMYAQACAHKYNVLVSRNRNSIKRNVLKKHFAAEKPPTPPPAVIRGLYEHTCQIAELQGKEVADVAAAAVIGAILPREWTPKMAAKTLAMCENFVQNLAVAPGHRVGDEPREYNLIDELNSCFEATSEEQFVVRCQEVQTNRPIMARSAEMRYHDTLRGKIDEIGIGLW